MIKGLDAKGLHDIFRRVRMLIRMGGGLGLR